MSEMQRFRETRYVLRHLHYYSYTLYVSHVTAIQNFHRTDGSVPIRRNPIRRNANPNTNPKP